MSDSPAPIRFRRLRQIYLPALLVLAPIVALSLPPIWQALDLDLKPLFQMGLFGMNITMICLLLLPIWFLLLSGYRWRTRFLGLGVAVGLFGGVVACVAEWDVTGSLLPYPQRYRWEPTQQALIERQEAEEGPPVTSGVDLTITAGSFPRYRGARVDGVVRGVRLATDWAEAPPKKVWQFYGHGGFAGFAVAGNVAITVEQRGDEEVVACYDQASGRERWKYGYKALFRDPTGNGPRATPTIDRGEVFSLGATGHLVCLNGVDGALKWEKNVVEENQAKVVTWGMTSSPLVTDRLVIVNAGIDPDNNAGRALVAYDRQNGKAVWHAGRHKAGYSSPQRATLAGVEQVLLFDEGGLAGFDLKTGAELWRHPWETFQDMNIIQPLVLSDDRVLISSETNNGCVMLRIGRAGKEWKVEELWQNNYLASKFSNPVAGGGQIYGMSNGWLVCLDEATGERRWRGRQYGHGQVLLVGEVLLVCGEWGEVALVETSPERFRELAKIKVFKDKTWNTPALAGRYLFVRNHRERACYELPVLTAGSSGD